MNCAPNPSPAAIAAADTLHHAALYVRHFGWCQHDYYHPSDGPAPAACTVGAVICAVTGRPDQVSDLYDTADYTTVLAALRVLADFLDITPETAHGQILAELELLAAVNAWNDQADNTEPDIIAALDAAADAWREDLTRAGVA